MAAKRRKPEAKASQGTQVDLAPLLDRLTTISRSLGVLALRLLRKRRPVKTDKQRSHILKRLGFDNQDIAGILAVPPSSVRAYFSKKRPGRRRKRKPRGKD